MISVQISDILTSPTSSGFKNAHTALLQVKNLRIQVEQESSKRVLAQNELKNRMQEVDRLRCSEKQLKQEINTALESKRSLEFQLAQLTK